jgi:cytochrome c peroxidase
MRRTSIAVAGLAAIALAATTAAWSIAASLAATDHWSAEELAVLSSMHISQLAPAPSDPSNAAEGKPGAIALGRQLFFDKRLSGNGAVSCASCHDPAKGFQDGLPQGRGVGLGNRRTMPVAGAGHSPWLFWDGRSDSLWAQALGPLENPAEHGGTRARYARLVQTYYREGYEKVFGAMPRLAQLPEDASPNGTPAQRQAWASLDEATRTEVTRIYANTGKAIAAYEKTLHFSGSRFDAYVQATVRGDPDAPQLLTEAEKRGLRIFIGEGRCATCHNGPLLTDQHFHNTGVPRLDPKHPDLGRSAATALVANDEFNCLGKFSDARPEQCEELAFMVKDDPSLVGAFKTPGLRGVALRAPYMHAGQFGSLKDVVGHYRKAPAAPVGKSELEKIRLSDADVGYLVAFLGTLDSAVREQAK